MVERWWGRRGVYAEDFSSLVRPAEGGILTTDLVTATRARGWDTRVFYGTPELIRQNLRHGAPVVTLISAGEARYHYVVVLGWNDGQVVFHDPATDPYVTIDEDSFLARWDDADRWALVVVPAPPAPVVTSANAAAPVVTDADNAVPVVPTMPCPPWLDRALDAVADNRLDDASSLLAQAGQACPTEPLVLRETAGVRFKQGRPAEASQLASEYLALVPDDEYGWQLLATSRYLAGDRDGALAAWNEIGRPTIDLVRIDGVRQIRFREIAGAMSAPPGTLLTPSRLAIARRRVADIPALLRATVEFQPVPGGIVEVRAAVVERPTVDPLWRLATVGAIRAVAQHEVSVAVSSPLGAGELWTGGWRWEAARPRGVFRLDMPAELGLPVVLAVESAWEQFRVALDPSGTTVTEEARRSASLGLGGWVTAGLRPSATLRHERWSGSRPYFAVSLGTEFRAWGDRLELSARSERAVALSAQPSYTSSRVRAAWASRLGLSRAAWSARLGFDWADRHAPLGSWPVVGGNRSWAIPLRAHPLTRNGLVAGRNVGRSIIHAGLTGDRPFYRRGPIVFAAGLFVDAARVVASADGSPDARFYLDGGAGLTIGIGEGEAGVLRIDLARGLVADRRFALTLGVHRSWPLARPGYR